MTALSISAPFPTFNDTDGEPLENGYIYIGTANQNPVTSPIAVYWDAALTIPAVQPIRTSGGYPVYNGTPANIYANSDYSIRVTNKNGTLVYSAAAETSRYGGGIIGAGDVTYTPSGTGAVATTVQSKLAESVSVKDFGAVGDGLTDDTAAVQAALNSGASEVVVPFNANVKITSEVTIPTGVLLRVDGTISGAGRITALGSTTIFGAGSVVCGNTWSIRLSAGHCVVSGIGIGKASCYGILILPTAQIDSLRITNTRISSTQYGILRNNNAGIAVLDALISNNVIEDSTGDGIEWNISYNDRRVKIDGNLVSGVNGAVVNSGIGIGVAGSSYSHTNDLTNYVQTVDITNNYVRGARQGIHTETTAKTKISGNHISDINNSYGNASIAIAGIICYAPVSTQISDNFLYDATSGIQVQFGVVSSVYTGSPQDVSISGNTLVDCTELHTQSSKYSSLTTFPMLSIKGNTLIRTSLRHQGVCHLVIADNTVKTAAGVVGFTLDYYAATFGASYQPNVGFQIKATNNQVFDELGRVNVSISNVSSPASWGGNWNLIQHGNSFTIENGHAPDRGVNRVVYSSISGQAGPSYGVEYEAGTLCIDTTLPGRYLVTVKGSRNRATDTYSVNDAANGIVQSTNYAWTSNGGAYHTLGQAISLFDGVTTVNAIVKQVYTTGGFYRMVLVNADGTTLNLGALGSGTITATNPLTFVAV